MLIASGFMFADLHATVTLRGFRISYLAVTVSTFTTSLQTAAELDEKLQAARERIEKELRIAVANLEEQKESTLKSLDSQVQALSEEIIGKIIPFKV